MNVTTKLLAASALLVAFAVPAFAIEPLSQQLEERNTYTNPMQGGWSANAMEMRTSRTMQMQSPSWTHSTNVSPASMNSGLEQQR
jgi:hypothetical protein